MKPWDSDVNKSLSLNASPFQSSRDLQIPPLCLAERSRSWWIGGEAGIRWNKEHERRKYEEGRGWRRWDWGPAKGVDAQSSLKRTSVSLAENKGLGGVRITRERIKETSFKENNTRLTKHILCLVTLRDRLVDGLPHGVLEFNFSGETRA